MEDIERGQGEDLVVIYRAPDEFIANLIKGFLVDDGIPVVLESRMVPWMNGVMKMGEGYWGDVVVPEKHAERGRQLIEEYHAQAITEDPADGDTEVV